MDKKTNDLKRLYYDVKIGFSTVDKLYEQAKAHKLKYTKKDIKEFYDKQAVKQILKPLHKQKEYSSFMANQPRHVYQMDIIVYDRYSFKKYKYMLVVIDIYSRFLQVRPMTNRKMITIIKNYNSIIDIMKAPEYLQSDNEFNKKEFIDILNKSNTKTRFTDPDEIHKNPIVERVNGTITRNIQKVRIALKRYDWINYIYDLVDNYNDSVHSTVKNKPNDIFNNKVPNKQKYTFIKNPFTIGDKARIARKKKVFDKADEVTYSKKVYIVESIVKSKVKLEGVIKLYKPYELDRVETLNEIDIEDIELPKSKTTINKRRNFLKREGIDSSNIIHGMTSRSKR
jgi:hypothetical protein